MNRNVLVSAAALGSAAAAARALGGLLPHRDGGGEGEEKAQQADLGFALVPGHVAELEFLLCPARCPRLRRR